jgi:uncharacterized membrane protein YdjX (TVP38/TMEM64 family)
MTPLTEVFFNSKGRACSRGFSVRPEAGCNRSGVFTPAGSLGAKGRESERRLMQKKGPAPVGSRRKSIVKALILAVFIVGAIVLVRFTPAKDYLTSEQLGRFLDTAGLWAPLVFIVIYTVGVCLFVPGTLLTGLGAAIFGPYLGFIYVWLGAMLGASAAFVIGRTLGRDFAASLVGDRLKKYDDAIERNGFAAVLYLRLVYFPFTPLNFGMGLTRVRFRDYIAGTGFGILVGTFIFTFFIGTLKQVWTSGDWGQLLSFKVFFSIALFVFSFFIPKIIKKIRGEA